MKRMREEAVRERERKNRKESVLIFISMILLYYKQHVKHHEKHVT